MNLNNSFILVTTGLTPGPWLDLLMHLDRNEVEQAKKKINHSLLEAKVAIPGLHVAYTLVHIAAWRGRLPSLKLLMSYPVCREMAEGRKGGFILTPLHLAAQAGREEVVRELVKTYDISMKLTDMEGSCTNGNSLTALHCAARARQTNVVRVLVEECGDNVTSVDKDGRTALHIAASNGNVEAVQILLGSGGDIRQTNEREETPVTSAFLNGQAEVLRVMKGICGVEELLILGKMKQKSFMHRAVLHYDLQLIHFLVKECSIDVNAPCDVLGCTPLHVAARRLSVDVVLTLLEVGADVTITNESHRTPLDVIAHTQKNRTHDVLSREVLWKRRCHFMMFIITQSYLPLKRNGWKSVVNPSIEDVVTSSSRPLNHPIHAVFYMEEMCRAIVSFL